MPAKIRGRIDYSKGREPRFELPTKVTPLHPYEMQRVRPLIVGMVTNAILPEIEEPTEISEGTLPEFATITVGGQTRLIWKEEHDGVLIELVNAGNTSTVIADKLGIRKDQVESRITRLALWETYYGLQSART